MPKPPQRETTQIYAKRPWRLTAGLWKVFVVSEAVDNTASKSEAEATPEFTPITSQDDLNKLIGERVARVKNQFADYKDLKAKASEFDKIAEASKSELDKAIERAEAAETAMQELKAAQELNSLAETKGVPMACLTGSPEERAAAIAEHLEKASAPRAPMPDMSQGQTGLEGDGGKASGSDWLREAAGSL